MIDKIKQIVAENLDKNAEELHVNAACSGFIYALHIGHAYIQASIYNRVLILGSDFNSRIMNYEDRGSAIFFGDGAGAAVLKKGNTGIEAIKIAGINDTQDVLV